MPRIRKTSTQPKRKPKKPVKIEKPVYPEYIENFIKEIETKTPFTVKVDQYTGSSTYHIGVNTRVGNVARCLWMVGFVDKPEYLATFWESSTYRSLTKD